MFNPVDTDIFKPRMNKKKYKKMFNLPTNKKVLSMSEAPWHKEWSYISIISFYKIRERDLILVYAGDGQEREKIENLINKHDLEEKVLLLGSVNQSSYEIFI